MSTLVHPSPDVPGPPSVSIDVTENELVATATVRVRHWSAGESGT